jgi:DME family drug/metabolite transporter
VPELKPLIDMIFMISKISHTLRKIPAHRKGLVYISFTALLWSSSGFFIKYLTLDAFQISFYRSGIAAATIYAAWRLRRKNPIALQNLSGLGLLSFFTAISYAGILIFFVAATKMTTAANAIFLQFSAPIYLLFLEPIFLKTRFEPRNLLAIVFCIGGMVLFFFGKLGVGDIYGNIIAIISGICFAFFTLFLKWRRQIFKDENTLPSVVGGNLVVALTALAVTKGDLAINGGQAIVLLYMGIFQIGISYVIFNEGIKYVSATESMIIAMMEAILNPIWVFIGIGEKPGVFSIIGGMVILAAILWRSLGKEKEKIALVD